MCIRDSCFDAPAPTLPSDAKFDAAIQALRSGDKVTLVLAGRALRAAPLALAGQIVQRTGCTMLAQYSNGRMERGAGRVPITRTPAPVDAGVAAFKDAQQVILIGAKVPAPMFGYPGKPDFLMQPGAKLIELTLPGDDLHATLKELAGRLGALGETPAVDLARELVIPSGTPTPDTVLRTIAALIPDNAIVIDESISAGRTFFPASMGARPHDYLQLTGGAIGSGIPMAVGAAIACPDRKVINMEGDGSSMYTIQALWTQAREKLDVLTIIFANRGYQILKKELVGVGAIEWGAQAERMLTIAQPDISWVKLAEGMGVEAAAADSCEQLADLMRAALARKCPFLIEVRMNRG